MRAQRGGIGAARAAAHAVLPDEGGRLNRPLVVIDVRGSDTCAVCCARGRGRVHMISPCPTYRFV